MVDDSVYATVSTAGREVIQMPNDPVKEDYTFEGWYWDKDVWRNQFTARSLLDTPLSSNMEVYAHFIDESYLKGTDINIKTAEKVNITGIGDVFYLVVRNNQLVCKFNDYVEINPHSTWTLSTDIAGNNTIASKTVELSVGDNPLYYIYVTDKDDRHETYIVLVHRNYMYTVSFNCNGGSSCSSQQVEEGYYLENIPTTTRKGYTFDRWDYDFKNQPIKSNVNARAIWTANNYKITYNPNGGFMNSESQTVTYDQKYELIIPSRLGYTFKGWKTSNGSYFSNSGTWTLDQNLTLTAEWEINYYSLTYELNGGSSSGIALKSSYTVEDSFVIPSPSRIGYTFKGWADNSSLSNAKIDYQVNKGTTGNLKFYAKWEANTYTVTYDVNGGDELENGTQTVTYGESTTLANPTKTGYDFAGWYNGSSKVSDGSWNIADDVTLTARWEATEYAIRYNLGGGTNNSENPLKYTIKSETITLNNPSREGYTFTGWTSESVSTPTFALTIPNGSTGEKQFTANWQANTYTVTYDVNGGNTITDNVKEYVFDSNITLLVPTRPGYNFAGWYYGTQLVTSGVWKIADDITLVARWSRVEFNIQYQLNDGNNNPSNPTSYNYDSETITLEDASRVGYTFLGWTSSDVDIPTKGIQIVHNSIGDKLFVANWQANTYTVTYDVNGGNSIGKTSEEIVFDEVLTLINPTRTGYTFSGWYSGTTLYESGVWKTAKDVTLVAKWTPNNYTITKENGSGAGSSTVTYDSDYNLGTSSKDGFDFDGWYTETNGQGTKYTDANGNSLNPYTDANDQTLYASFIYHITFVSNGGSYVPTLTLHENECLSDAIVSKKENRTFAGWFTDIDLTKPVSYSQPLGNVTLYAKWAEEISPAQMTYSFLNNEVTITGCSYDGNNLILPTHIGGIEVCKIGTQAFANQSNSTTLFVPETVRTIDKGAFVGCISLETITLPFVGKSIDAKDYEAVFGFIFGYTSSSEYAGNLNYSLYEGAPTYFYNRDFGKSSSGGINQFSYVPNGQGTSYPSRYWYNIPAGITNVTITKQTVIPLAAFNKCSMIEKITIPSDTTDISSFAFQNCDSLSSLNSDVEGQINIPSDVSVIKKGSFKNCNSIKDIKTSNLVSKIEDYAFADSKNIEFFNSIERYSLNIPFNCESVGSYSFQNLESIKRIVVLENVEVINNGAFNGCNSLESITLPFIGKSLNATGYEAVFGYIFGYSSSSEYAGDLNYSLYEGAPTYFYNRDFGKDSSGGINQFSYVPNGQGTSYPTRFWYYVPASLSDVTITVQDSIPMAAFNRCEMLENIYLVSSIKSTGKYAFQGCDATIHYTVEPVVSGAWDGVTVASDYHGGSGTENDPYQIFSPDEFIFFIQQINSGVDYSNVYFVLTSNIDMGNNSIPQISQTLETMFNGVLDGNNKKIKNLSVDCGDNNYSGLFGFVGGTIKNITFENITLNYSIDDNQTHYCGLLVGYLSGTINDVNINGAVNFTSKKTCYVGGLVGYNSGTINSCNVNVDVTTTSTGLRCYAGGIIGYNAGSIENSLFSGNITAHGYSDSYTIIGNIVGYEE